MVAEILVVVEAITIETAVETEADTNYLFV